MLYRIRNSLEFRFHYHEGKIHILQLQCENSEFQLLKTISSYFRKEAIKIFKHQ